MTFSDRDAAIGRVSWQLDKIAETGVGRGIPLEGLELKPVSEHLALCHMTWSIRPINDTPPWTWTNVYALRQAPDASLYFEAVFADNEIAELLKRFPDVFAG